MKKNNHEENYSDKLADVAKEAEKDHAREGFDPLENYDIEGKDVPEDDGLIVVPMGNPVPGFESQHQAGEVVAFAPVVKPDDGSLLDEDMTEEEWIEESGEEVLPLRPDGTLDPRAENPVGLGEDESPLQDHGAPMGADDVDERPFIERIADVFDGARHLRDKHDLMTQWKNILLIGRILAKQQSSPVQVPS